MPQDPMRNMPGMKDPQPVAPGASMPDMGYTRVYDDAEGRTRVWDKNGFKGYEAGNTEKLGSLIGPVDRDPSGKPPADSVVRGSDGRIDIPKTIGNIGQDIIPAIVNMALPETTLLDGLSPAMKVAAKMGTSTVGGTALDQLMNLISSHGGDSGPLLDSVTKAGSNALSGIGLPELLNVGPTFNKVQRTSTRTATPSTSESTSSLNSSTSSEGNSSGTSSGTSVGSKQSTADSSTQGSSQSHTTSINDVASQGMSKNLSHSDAVKLGFQPSDQVTETIRIDPVTKKFVKVYTVTKNVPREGQYQTNTTVDQNGSSEYDRISRAIFGSDTEDTSQSSTQSSSASGSQTERQGNTTGQRSGTTQTIGTRQGTTVNTPGVSQTVSDQQPPWYIKIAQMVGSRQYPSNGPIGNSSATTSVLGLIANLLKGNLVQRQTGQPINLPPQ